MTKTQTQKRAAPEKIDVSAEVFTQRVPDAKKAEKLRIALSRIPGIRTASTPDYGNGELRGYRVKWWSVAKNNRERLADQNQAKGRIEHFMKS